MAVLGTQVQGSLARARGNPAGQGRSWPASLQSLCSQPLCGLLFWASLAADTADSRPLPSPSHPTSKPLLPLPLAQGYILRSLPLFDQPLLLSRAWFQKSMWPGLANTRKGTSAGGSGKCFLALKIKKRPREVFPLLLDGVDCVVWQCSLPGNHGGASQQGYDLSS